MRGGGGDFQGGTDLPAYRYDKLLARNRLCALSELRKVSVVHKDTSALATSRFGRDIELSKVRECARHRWLRKLQPLGSRRNRQHWLTLERLEQPHC